MKSSPLKRSAPKRRSRGVNTPDAPLPRNTPCLLAARSLDPCDGPIDRAHLISKQRMRQAGHNENTVWDPRSWIPSCRAHHEIFDRGFLRLRYEELPRSLVAFAEEIGMGWSLERDFERGEEAA